MTHQIQLTIICSFLFILFSYDTNSQDILDFVNNPSFEDTPKKGGYYNNILEAERNEIKGWNDCGKLNFENESAPDIHGGIGGYWRVKMKPSAGSTFLGLVVRDNNSWEEVSQELLRPLKEGYCYTFTIDLAKANPYISGSRLHNVNRPKYNYNKAVNLRIWGGVEVCENYELLYLSSPVDNEEWQSYEITIQPISEIKYISLQAYYVDDDEPYNGNILVDNISKFVVTECKD